MRVTISIINYNYGRFLNQAIESALDQHADGATIEVLVLDDGSTDESDAVIAEYKSNPRFRSSKTENRGFGATLTRAVVEASGDYVFLMDADDYFAPGKVAALMPSLLNGALYTSDPSSYVDEGGNLLRGGAWGSTSTVAINRLAALDLLPVENELSFVTFSKLGRSVILESSHTFYRVHGKSMTNRRQPGKWKIYLSKVTHNLADRLQDLSARSKPPAWMDDRRRAIGVSREFRAEAYYAELEAALELRRPFRAIISCYRMLYWQLRSGARFKLLHYKMIIRTIILRPSHPKG